MEITQHANPRVNTLLMKHTALLPSVQFCSQRLPVPALPRPRSISLLCASGCNGKTRCLVVNKHGVWRRPGRPLHSQFCDWPGFNTMLYESGAKPILGYF